MQQSVSVISSRFQSYLHMRIGSVESVDDQQVSAIELDSHADSPVVGRFAKVLEDTGRKVQVSGFTSELGKPISVPVVHAAVAYDCEYTGKTHILVIHNALYLRTMNVNLIPPFMMHLAGLEVNECPKFLSKVPSESQHSVYFPQADLRLPFQLEGIVSYLPSRVPTEEELSTNSGEYLMLTPSSEDWNPHSVTFKEQEFSMLDYKGEIKTKSNSRADRVWISAVNQSCVSSLDTAESLAMSIEGVTSSTERVGVTATKLAERWRIPLELAKRTIEATTQRCVRSTEVPTLNHRFKTNDRMLRYSRVLCNVIMDTFFASTRVGPSTRGNTCCQLFATEFGHVFVVPLPSKTGVSITAALKRYFKDVGVPPMMICDAAREQIKGDSRVLCYEAGCQIYELEKGTPAANRAERYIKMVKDDSKKDMGVSHSPMVFWDYVWNAEPR